MRKLAVFLLLAAASALGACSGVMERVTGLTGLTTEQLQCIGLQVASLPTGTPPREAAGIIAVQCGVDVDRVILGIGEEPTTVVSEGQSVLVTE